MIEQVSNTKNDTLDEKRIKRWNLFIDDVCNREYIDLSPLQRKAVLCFWYDAEVNSGGHSGFFDCYPEINPSDLEDALRCIGNEEIAENFISAANTNDEESNCWEDMDNCFYAFSPALTDLIEQYVEDNRAKMFSKYPNLVRVQWGPEYDDASYHINKIEMPELSEYNHIAIFLRWMTENDLLSEELLEVYPELPQKVKNNEIDLRLFMKKTEELHGCICQKHFNKEGRHFAEYFYNSGRKNSYVKCVDRYALEFFGQKKYKSMILKNKTDFAFGPKMNSEAYLLLPYVEEYYNAMSLCLDDAWENFKTKFLKKEIDAKNIAEKLVKDIVHALHEKRYGDVEELVDECEIDDMEDFLKFVIDENLELNGYDRIDDFGVPCNFNPNYEYSQLKVDEYDDESGFMVEYDLTSNSELVYLVLQLRIETIGEGVKTIFENIDPQ